jgi:two-component system chemotaxis response regulator CheB
MARTPPFGTRPLRRQARPAKNEVLVATTNHPDPARVPLVVLAGSAGGLQAVERIFEHLDPGLPAAILVLLHVAPDHPSLIAALLTRHAHRPVHDASEGEPLRPGLVAVAPSGIHLEVRPGGVLHLSDLAPVRYSRPSIDVLLNSLAGSRPRRTLAVILTGTGHDGEDGAVALRDAGGAVLVQEPATAAFPAMPQAVIDAGAFDDIAPLDEMGRRIESYVTAAAADV